MTFNEPNAFGFIEVMTRYVQFAISPRLDPVEAVEAELIASDSFGDTRCTWLDFAAVWRYYCDSGTPTSADINLIVVSPHLTSAQFSKAGILVHWQDHLTTHNAGAVSGGPRCLRYGPLDCRCYAPSY